MKENQTSKIRLPVHDLGTLNHLTRWINKHDEGIAELLKNVRAAYQENRANVKPEERVAVILIKDSDNEDSASIGLLDVGGLTFEDVEKWSVWDDPDASSRGGIKQEENQGNGGKAYMYRLFEGPAFIIGVKNDKQNQVGFIGKRNSLERGIPRFPTTNREVWQPGEILNPNEKEKDISLESWKEDLINNLFSLFKTGWTDLPKEVRNSLEKRNAFTLVVGNNPINWSEGKSNVKQFIGQLIKHQQAQRAIQQIKIYVVYNGKFLFDKPLELEEIEPYPKFKGPYGYDLPHLLLAPNGNQVNTLKSSSGKHSPGKITLFTSKENMEVSYKTLKPRWIVVYSTDLEEVGQKSIAEISPNTPGAHFIHAKVHLNALSPDSVDAGRKRPNDTLLVLAVDKFLAEKIKELAKKIYDLQKEEVNKDILDDIKKENDFLDKLKNKFLPTDFGGLFGFGETNGEGTGKKKNKKSPRIYGEPPYEIKISSYSLRIAQGVEINLSAVLYPSVKDKNGNAVKSTDFTWKVMEGQNITLDKNGKCIALNAGECKINIAVDGTDIKTPPIVVEVISIKDILLSPRNIEVSVGHNKQIISQVTTVDNKRYTDVILNWRHDAPDQNLVKISPRGYVFGNKIGKTLVYAGAKNIDMWVTNATAAEITPSNEKGKSGSGLPSLRVTDRDTDLVSGELRRGDPEEPALWQTASDFKSNIWWINTQSKDANFASKQREQGNEKVWKLFHCKLLVEMMVQVHLNAEYTNKGEEEQPTRWSDHKFFYDRKYVELTQAMWPELEKFINGEINIE